MDSEVDKEGELKEKDYLFGKIDSHLPTTSVIITELPEEDERPSTETMGSKGPYLRAAKLTRTAAKDVISEALEFLDKEAEHLRAMNNNYIVENNKIKEENESLRKELEALRSERAVMLNSLEKAEGANAKLKDDIKNHIQKFKEEKKTQDNVHNKLLDENAKFVKQLENLRKEVTVREAQLQEKASELEQVKRKLEDINRKNNNDRHMELLHEVEVLKSERRNLFQEKGATLKENKNLQEEVTNLENSLESKVSELNNENRRHFLLTKEFNSLLEENNRLKQQMRTRVPPGTPSGTRKLNTSVPGNRVRQLASENSDVVTGYAETPSPTLRRSNTQATLPIRKRGSNPNLMARTYTTMLDTNLTMPSRLTQDDVSLSGSQGSLPSLGTKKGNWKP